MNLAVGARAALTYGALVLASCSTTSAYRSGVGVPQDQPWYYAPVSPYYDWFAYDPRHPWPYYHGYPNLDYYVEYRPIYPPR
jgi:hypothetical protein